MSLNEKQKQMLIGGIIVAVFLGFLIGYYYILTIKPALQNNETKITELNKDNGQLARDLARINALLDNEEERARIQQIVDRAKVRLPQDTNPIEFLNLLRQNISKTNVDASGQIRDLDPNVYNAYVELPFRVSGTARYHAFGQFLNLIECNPNRFMRVNEFKLKTNTRRPSQHDMELMVSTFAFRNSIN